MSDRLNQSYWPAAVIGLLGLAIITLLPSCSGGGKITTPLVKLTPPMSLLGQLQVASYNAEVRPDGTTTVSMAGFGTRNPDPELTRTAAKAATTITGINAGVDLLQPISNSAGTALTNISQ